MPPELMGDTLERIAISALTRIDQHEKFCAERERKMDEFHKKLEESIIKLAEKFDAKFFWVYTFLLSLLVAVLVLLLQQHFGK